MHPLDENSTPKSHHRELYYRMLEARGQCSAQTSLQFLKEQLEKASLSTTSDLPGDPALIMDWIRNQANSVAGQYQLYLGERRSGAPRRYFESKSQALWFLQAISPTKLVDGAWLASCVAHWQDHRFLPLIQTYLEELGDGIHSHNHVAVYSRLLVGSGCVERDDLPDAYYTQGAIQLSLGVHGDAFVPEMIGFNLGYEQLPLHLLITAFELDELGLDPWYFTLHATIDNADTGHAEKAVRTLKYHWPRFGDTKQFFERLSNGYRLNMLGMGSEDVIRAFDLEQELVATLERKASLGALMHCGHSQVAGKPVTEWLQEGCMRKLLDALEKSRWIVRRRPVGESRFWQLLEGPAAPMFGVFNEYELQLLREWITDNAGVDQSRPLTFRHRKAFAGTMPGSISRAESRPRPILRDRFFRRGGYAGAGSELREFEDRLLRCSGQNDFMKLILPLLQPANHSSAVGLMATRIYKQLVA